MWKTFVRRILIMIPQLLILSLLLFFLATKMPGDAFTGMIDPKVTPQVLEELRIKHGFYDPWHVKYTRWMGNIILHGDFGNSIKFQRPVVEVIGERATNTFWLSLLQTIILYAVAVPLGIIAGRYRGRWSDRIISLYSYVALAMPTIVFGIINILIFVFTLRWFPAGGTVSIHAIGNPLAEFFSRIHHMLLPALTGALVSTTGTIMYLRSEIVEYENSDFVLTARSKGVPQRVVYSKHILRNSLIPVASSSGYVIVGLISGSIFLESVFSYPGMGKLFIDSIVNRDYAIVNALVMLFALLTVVGTLLSDMILAAVDPRIRIK